MIVRGSCNLCRNEVGNTVGRSFTLRRHDCPDPNWRNYLDLTGAAELTVDFMVCGACGQLYQRQILDEKETEELRRLDLAAWNRQDRLAAGRRTGEIINSRRFAGVIRFLVDNLGTDWKGKKVLDVGGREGGFGIPLIERGAEYTAVDVDDYRDRAVPGAVCLTGDFDTFDFSTRFDVIVLNHVLEHVELPPRTLARCYDLLNGDGNVLIDVPNLPLWPGTQHRSEFQINQLLVEACRRAGLAMVDQEQILLGYGPSIIRDFRLLCRKDATVKAAPSRSYRDYTLNVLSDYHYDLLRALSEQREPFVIYGVNDDSRRILEALPLESMTLTGFVDDDPALWGTVFRGRPVASPEALDGRVQNLVILTPNREETRQRMRPLAEQGVALILNHRYL